MEVILPYIFPYITPFKEFGLWLMWVLGPGLGAGDGEFRVLCAYG